MSRREGIHARRTGRPAAPAPAATATEHTATSADEPCVAQDDTMKPNDLPMNCAPDNVVALRTVQPDLPPQAVEPLLDRATGNHDERRDAERQLKTMAKRDPLVAEAADEARAIGDAAARARGDAVKAAAKARTEPERSRAEAAAADADPEADCITIIRSHGNIAMTKVWRSDGAIDDYERAKHFQVSMRNVSSIRELAARLEKLARIPSACIIRGRLAPDAVPEKPGLYLRNKKNFHERPLHMAMFDIDGFEPVGVDAVLEPEAAVRQFIAEKLPLEFHEVTCYWRLSSSAGSAKNVGKLKCHLWFWLEHAYTGGQMEVWRATRAPDIDRVSFRTVQIHYTADPLFDEGVADPVPVRGGLIDGLVSDAVPLVIPEGYLALARDQNGTGSDIELVDPKEKPGTIGAFCRAFEMDTILEEHLADVFEYEDPANPRRLNFLQGRGAKGGAFISACREYISNTHHTDPFAGRATNKFDLLRHYKFGHLDDDDDPFDADVTNSTSHHAMVEWARTLPEVQAQLEREKERQAATAVLAAGDFQTRIDAAQTEVELVTTIAPEIRADVAMGDYPRDKLAKAIQKRVKAITGTEPSLPSVRKLLKPERVLRNPDEGFTGPLWARDWVWVSTEDRYVHRDTKIANTITSFNTRFAGHRGDLTMGEESHDPHTMMSQFWGVPVVERRMYYPRAGDVFELEGVRYLNDFRSELVVKPDPDWLPAGEKLRVAIERHLALLIPDARERAIFRAWLAFNYRNPGLKIRWTPILKGCEGDGKSIFLDLLGVVLGAENTATLAGDTILNSSFTGWASGSCVTMIEEVRFQGHNRFEVANRLKPYITNNRVELHAKGKDPRPVLNVTNYLAGTNHVDMLPLTESDRRYLILHSPFSSNAQLDAALRADYGMSRDDHFDEIFDLTAANPGQLALWLHETRFPDEFQPNGNAPMTEAKRITIAAGEGDDVDLVRALLDAGARGVFDAEALTACTAWKEKPDDAGLRAAADAASKAAEWPELPTKPRPAFKEEWDEYERERAGQGTAAQIKGIGPSVVAFELLMDVINARHPRALSSRRVKDALHTIGFEPLPAPKSRGNRARQVRWGGSRPSIWVRPDLLKVEEGRIREELGRTGSPDEFA